MSLRLDLAVKATIEATSRLKPPDPTGPGGLRATSFLDTYSSDMAAFAEGEAVHIVFTYTITTLCADGRSL
jgi:hypothetical protein